MKHHGVSAQADYSKYNTIGALTRSLIDSGKARDADSARRKAHEMIPKGSYYQKKILEALRARWPQGRWRKNAAGIGQSAGEPDIDGVLEGRFYAFEVKRPLLGRVSDLQELAIRQINEAGGVALVVTYPEEALVAVWRTYYGKEYTDDEL